MNAKCLITALSCLVALGLTGSAAGQGGPIVEDAFDDANVQFAVFQGGGETVVLGRATGPAGDKYFLLNGNGNLLMDCEEDPAACLEVAKCVQAGGGDCTGGGGTDNDNGNGEKGWLGKLIDKLFKKKDKKDEEEKDE